MLTLHEFLLYATGLGNHFKMGTDILKRGMGTSEWVLYTGWTSWKSVNLEDQVYMEDQEKMGE